jgi:serine/threonine protein kinase
LGKSIKSGARIGQFVIKELLSKGGGTAEVYHAAIDREDSSNHGASVALKMTRIGEQNSDVYEDLLIKETDLLHDLRHPGIVRLCPMIQFEKPQYIARAPELVSKPDEAPWYFVMELLVGGQISEVFGQRKFSLAWRVELIYQIAVIIDYIHLRQIAHRDLKPENILLRNVPHPQRTPMPVLIDFGLAEKRRLHPEVSAATLSYAAPERVKLLMADDEGTQTDHFPADIWSLGVIAYQLVTGGYPFGDPLKEDDLAERIMEATPDPIGKSIPPNLLALVLDMLNKSPEDRPRIETVIQRLETQIEIVAPRTQA